MTPMYGVHLRCVDHLGTSIPPVKTKQLRRRSCASQSQLDRKKEFDMLWTIFVVLLVLWLLGLVSSYTLGGFIHILLVLALVVLVINLLSGRRSAV
jgi:Family of unknown function (DUF5670)